MAFSRQFWALFRKNWIVLSKHRWINLSRCLILPFAYGIFLAVAQVFLIKPNHYGLGTPAPVASLADVFVPSLALIWADGTIPIPGTLHPSPADVMALVTQSLHPAHRSAVRQVASVDAISPACRQNFNLFSECFAAVAFTSFPAPTNVTLVNITNIAPPSISAPLLKAPPNGTEVLPSASLLNYTIHADAGLGFIDVVGHRSDYERRVLPLQWAIDSAIIQLQTGQTPPPTPLEWPYSIETDQQQALDTRLGYVRNLRTLLVIALFLNFVGISYHLPGAYVTERTAGLTVHLQAMGLRELPRIVSWHVSISLAYFPGWILTAILWKFRIFSGTSVGIMIVVHLLTGLSLASYTFVVALPSYTPSLAAATSTFAAIILAILALVFAKATTSLASVFVLLFPPAFFVFAVRAIAGFEVHQIPTSVLKGDPDNNLILLPLIIVAIIDVFLYPWLVVWLERWLYNAGEPSSVSALSRFSWHRSRRARALETSMQEVAQGGTLDGSTSSQEAPAIVVRHISKVFRPSFSHTIFRPWRLLSFKGPMHDSDHPDAVTAIADLSFTVPRGGIFVLLGSNGAGKSTVLGLLAGLIGRSAGEVIFPEAGSIPKRTTATDPEKRDGAGEVMANGSQWEGARRPPIGSLGIVPQKSVLFPELTCFQTMRLWSAVKRHGKHPEESPKDLEQLLLDCGLEGKIHENAGSLSGGQKRKLQLAIGLVGGSEIVLVDECTSGVDPLSRRSIWRALTAIRNERTIVFTTHFLDEADLLADHIAILAAPGKLVAEGSPVALKSRLGKGYTLQVAFADAKIGSRSWQLLKRIQETAPDATLISSASTSSSPNGSAYQLNSKDSRVVKGVLDMLEAEKTAFDITSYEVHGTSIEDIFLDLMAGGNGMAPDVVEAGNRDSQDNGVTPSAPGNRSASDVQVDLQLTSGRKRSPLAQSLTIFYKRYLITRRSWLSTLFVLLVAVAGSCIPLFFMKHRAESCTTRFQAAVVVPLYIGNSPYSSLISTTTPSAEALITPPGLLDTLGASATGVSIVPLPDNSTFVSTVQENYQDLSLGGVSVDLSTGESLFAWEATPPGLTAPTLLNLVSNVLYNRALNASGRAANQPSIIAATYQSFPFANAGTLFALKWFAFFGATMGVFPAFFAMYVALERRSSIQAMQLSNGLTNPAGLWLGHLLFDGAICTIIASIIIIVFATASTNFHGLGYLWLVFVLYGLAATLFAYCVSLFTASPLAAFSAVAYYQVILFILYLSGYLLTLTYAKSSQAANIITIIHFTVSLCSPVASVLRAALVSVNLFSLLCDHGQVNVTDLGSIKKYGGPIVYLIVECLIFFSILVYVDSGSVLPRSLQFTRPPLREADAESDGRPGAEDVIEEMQAVEASSGTDLLRVLHLSKTFDRSKSKAVDDVSFGVSENTVFAMLGPNGAGKTSTFNIIRGDIYPDSGDVFINGASVIAHPNTARLSLGVCPQFTAIDPQLTVRQHLIIYGLLKGLRKGLELQQNIDELLRVTTLDPYADRLAKKLSGGNQRKLSFAIALIGNPAVVLVDEYTTGIDPATKRNMWITFRRMAVGKAVVVTTHSMEEASALANKVGILAGRMLAVGSPGSLADRYALYEVHLPARTREETMKARQLMAHIPGSRMAEDVATRFEVPIRTEQSVPHQEAEPISSTPSLSLAQLFEMLSAQNDFPEYTVEPISLESVFLKVIRQHNVQEEDTIAQMRRHRKRIWRVC